MMNILFIGMCLGSQLLAKVCGAKVGKSPRKEIGFTKVQLTDKGGNDPLFKGLGEEIDVFQWHEDMFAVPEGAKLLATSRGLFPLGFSSRLLCLRSAIPY